MRNSLRLDLSSGFYLMLAFMLLLIPLKWCFAFLLAGLFHEFCHFFAVRLCGGTVSAIHAGNYGTTMEARELSPYRALLCTLAGPLGALLLLPLARIFPRLALCAAVQSCINLLPLSGLDGGHALKYIFLLALPRKTAEKLYCKLQKCFLWLFLALGIYSSFILKLGPLSLTIYVALILKTVNGKTPCKYRSLGVQ